MYVSDFIALACKTPTDIYSTNELRDLHSSALILIVSKIITSYTGNTPRVSHFSASFLMVII